MNEKSTQRVIAYIEESISTADSKAFAAELELNPELRKMEQGLRAVLKAESRASLDEGELPQAFEDAVMRRIRVAPPPHARMPTAGVDSFVQTLRSTVFGSYRMQAVLITSCALLLMLGLSPEWRGVLTHERPAANGQHFLAMYDAVRNESSARIINAMTARIPAGYRALSLDVKGWSRPGEHVDVIWLAELQSKSVSALIVQDARVISNERDPSADDADGMSTVTILVPAEDAAKVELARATGEMVLSVRDSTQIDESPVEEFIMRGGSLIPKA